MSADGPTGPNPAGPNPAGPNPAGPNQARPNGAVAAVGAPIATLDARRRVTGRVPYAVDATGPGLLHGAILRSAAPHARIARIDVTPALGIAGVVAAVTAADLPDASRRHGIVVRDTPALAHDRVRYAGEPVAAVAAVDPEVARAALARIVVELEPLPAAFTADGAMASGAVAIHGGGNLVGEQVLREGDVDAAFGTADVVVTGTFETPPTQGVPLEPHAVLAEWSADGDLILVTNTQTPFHVRREVAHLLDLEPDQVRVHVPPLGGGFGSKAYTRIEPIAALLARKAGRPVRIVLSRAEEFVTVLRQASTIRLATATRADGRLLALRAEAIFLSGAFAENTPRILRHAIYGLPGPYRYAALDVAARGVLVNTPPCGPLRAPGTAQVTFAREGHLDAIAAALGMDPVELRRRNLVRATDRFVLGGPVGPVQLAELLDAVRQPVPTSPASGDGVRRVLRGTGHALALKTTQTPSRAEATIRVDANGLVEVLTATVDMGQGSGTALAQVAADALGVDAATVSMAPADTATVPHDDGTVSSRSTFSMGRAITLAAGAVRARLLDLAATRLEIAATDLGVSGGAVAPVDGSIPGVSFGELLAAAGLPEIRATAAFVNESMVDPVTGERGVSTHHHQAAASAAVEVDTATGAVRVADLRLATHAGRVVNPILAALQSDGNAVFGLGQALLEEVLLDEGQLLNANLADYVVPSIRDVPSTLTAILHEDGHGELHGIGETVLPAVVPAITNAIAAATGARLHVIPATPERVLRAIRDARDAGPA